MGLFTKKQLKTSNSDTKKKRKNDKVSWNDVIIHEHTFDEPELFIPEEPVDQIVQSTPRETYEDFLKAQTEMTDDERLLQRYETANLEHYKIEEYDYNKIPDDKPLEVGFDDVYDVNYEQARRVPPIKRIMNSQRKIDAIIATAELLKPKF